MIGMGRTLTPNNETPAVAVENARYFRDAFKADYVPRLSAGRYFVDMKGGIPGPAVIGDMRIRTDAAFGYPTPNMPRGVQIIQRNEGPVLRACGAGLYLDDPIQWVVSDGVSAAIEVEGRAYPATGRCRLRNQLFLNCGAWLRCLGGYYEGDKFTPDQNHADNIHLYGCEGANCRRGFWSQNEQAVNVKFLHCVSNNLGAEDKDCLAMDLEKGGDCTFIGHVVNHPWFSIARLKDYSPNCCKIIFRDFNRDRCPEDLFPGQYLRLLEYTGSGAYGWEIDISGSVKTHFAPMDSSLAFKGCENLPRNRWRIDVPGYVQYKGEDVL